MELDDKGYFLDVCAWRPEHAEQLAALDGLVLSGAHWEILNFLREYYQNYQMAPPMRLMTKAVASKLGADKGSSLYLYQLFPDGPAKQASRYAGLPKPVSCI